VESRHLGQRVRSLREAKGFSQKGLASAARIGIATLSRIENGKHDPTQTTLQRLAGALGISLSALYSEAEHAAFEARGRQNEMVDSLDRLQHKIVDAVLKAVRKELRLSETASERRPLLHGTEPEATTLVPLLGRVSAGGPSPGEEDVETWIPVPNSLLGKRKNLFVVRARGNSMEPTIQHDDLVICQAQAELQSGDIVVAFFQGEGTIKRFVIHGTNRALVADNPAYQTADYSGDFMLNGKVVALLRRF
jgi:SOS-response transcriptional repressor LexA